ncbi:MAG: helicase HerA domain-containing protein [Candidatus Heimdallarchaeaceae archaeon]
MDHLSRAPLFKAVLVTTNDLPFKLEPDIPEKLEGRKNWANRNYEFHKNKAEKVGRDIKGQQGVLGGPFPKFLPKQMKEEEDYARKFLNSVKSLESQMQDYLKPYFIIKDNLFAAALFFYVYTTPKDSLKDCVDEIVRRRYSAKMEISKTYFVRCSDVKDPVIVFNPELYPFFPEHTKYFGLALTKDVAGFNSDKDIGIGLRKMFTTVLELPKEEAIEERIHIPTKEISTKGIRHAYLGHVMKSVVHKKVTKSRVYFPLDVLTSHAIIFGKTRTGKSFFSLILIKEALEKDVEVWVFDPHGTLSDRLRDHRNLKIVLTHGRADITERLQSLFDETSSWPETNQLKRLVVLDETRLLKAKNLVYCINELGKRGVGFVLITQYSTSIPPEIRNVGTYFIMAAMSETEIKRFKDVTLHPSSKLIGRLPRASSFVYSPYWYPEPFFIKHRKL